jgi:hypothetical protein
MKHGNISRNYLVASERISFPIEIHFLDMVTLETAIVRTCQDILSDDSWQDWFIWSDGNYACDCNRHQFFELAKNRQPNDIAPCGWDRYRIVKIVAVDDPDVILYKDKEI